jgi:sugar phosphate permease
MTVHIVANANVVQGREPVMTTAVADEPKANLGAWWLLAVILALSLLSYIDRTVIVMLVEPIQQNIHLNDFEMSLILGPAFSVLYAVFSLPSGWAADKLSRRWLIFAGVIIWSITTMACGLASSFAGLFIARMLVAAGEATLGPAAYSVITDRFPTRRLSTALAIYNMAPKLGGSLAYIIGGLLFGLLTGWGVQHLSLFGALQPWQMLFLVIGAPGIPLAFLAFSFRDPARTRQGDVATQEVRLLHYLKEQKAVLIPLFLGFCLIGIANGAMNSWVATYMARDYGWAPARVGPAIGVVSGVAALLMIPKGLAIDWLFARGIPDAPLRFYTWLLAICTPLAPLSYFVPSPYLFLVLYALTAAIAIPLMLYASATLRLIAPSALRGRLIGVIIFMVPIFMSLGAPMVGLLTDFVFRDPKSIGKAIAIVSGTTIFAGFLTLRYTMRPLAILLADLKILRASEEKAI